ncbi:MAG: outer membrane lipid asymmetry maintenance protein MlaD [Alphaproteobacteria bacterium]|nr:outer membrane lipid asymmetry maintenance protein MlaD [Alphaproteobacteria bacterium]MCD8520101.1 outer membrane lipid asymmetry maintenance protein MlaD [Alphaproteobacteria bacterium]MCD8525877.1 outer membrane lipid asymmetry maintenance protein MlaD [Alphaproteobacteria bacterium]MCD8570737.1 outer membrane lipid asymmetry maintenance protein MlaD [Alphaproteobacteria bacterium]
MKRSAIETILGAIVLLVAGFFLVFGYKTANVSAGANGYSLIANFSGIGGLKAGDDVQISGVKVGTVAAVSLDPETFLARVHMMVEDSVQLPVDTAALISSESLLGGRYLALEPGADEEIIQPGGTIQYTQAPQNLEQLLGQFIFSVSEDKDKDAENEEEARGGEAVASAPAAPVTAEESTPAPAPEVVEQAPVEVAPEAVPAEEAPPPQETPAAEETQNEELPQPDVTPAQP